MMILWITRPLTGKEVNASIRVELATPIEYVIAICISRLDVAGSLKS